jgi:hypothetical protein
MHDGERSEPDGRPASPPARVVTTSTAVAGGAIEEREHEQRPDRARNDDTTTTATSASIDDVREPAVAAPASRAFARSAVSARNGRYATTLTMTVMTVVD